MKVVPKSKIQKLSDKKITRAEYNEIIEEISSRVDDIWKFIIKASGRTLDWYSFSNDKHEYDGNGSDGGEFDPRYDAEFIEIIGESSWLDGGHYDYNEGFPTKFLWDANYEEEVLTHVKQAREQIKLAKENKKIQKTSRMAKNKEIIAGIRAKLSKEELKLVKFKK